eukprot:CAMPEP_0184863990 /NCGR_PEP_ID=MMETSP0580-20130426/13271_1 /TAXON_ID=1118495 /ORGANISM="Dactyliosolen fragilissimus" /LENGTH=576 /DNA_ID=CAMNT_0027362609 /DNA_START=22 /DNA_END=1752 /DNA_ORIENTATION=+
MTFAPKQQHLMRRRINRAFKMRGLSIQLPAIDALMNVLKRESPQVAESVLLNIIDEVKDKLMKQSSTSSSYSSQVIVTKSLLSNVVAELSRDGEDITNEALQLLDAFETPRLFYDGMKKQFTLLERVINDECGLLGEPVDKINMFLQRYLLVQQRILRQDVFRPKLVTSDVRNSFGDGNVETSVKLTPIESLLGRKGKQTLMGMIVQVEEGKYYLEDVTAQVPIDLSEASIATDGFIMENCIVLVEGEMVDDILMVHLIGNPIYENRMDALNAVGLQNSDIFNAMPSLAELTRMREQEEEHGADGMFVMLSDVHLDKPSTLSKLEKLFAGFETLDPLPVFVLMGNFTSQALLTSKEGPKQIMGYFEDLGNLISKFPRITNEGRIIFIPGPNDPGLGGVLPRPPIPNYFTGALRSKVSHAIFTSNPCRVRFFSKEIVLYRQDMVFKFRRNCIIPPRKVDGEDSSTENNTNHIAKCAIKTMLDQGHLSPLPLSSTPIHWKLDHAMRLYPPPDAVIVGDSTNQYYEDYNGCDVINPGPFIGGTGNVAGDFSFVVYRPVGDMSNQKEDVIRSDVEFSQID